MKKAMNFLGKAGKYGETGVHEDLVCTKFSSVAAERIVNAVTTPTPKPDGLSVQPLNIQSLNDGR